MYISPSCLRFRALSYSFIDCHSCNLATAQTSGFISIGHIPILCTLLKAHSCRSLHAYMNVRCPSAWVVPSPVELAHRRI